MASFNKITIVGYLGRDPELRYSPQGTPICSFSIATTEKQNSNGERRELTTWFQVTTWGKQAEVCHQYLHKGSQAYVEGRARLEEYTDREGAKRSSLKVTATDVKFLGGRGETDIDDPPQHEEAPSSRQQSKKAAAPPPEDDEIPF